MFRKHLQHQSNYTRTENNALTLRSTLNPVLDLFSMGGALRTRSEEEVIQLGREAMLTDPLLALKCMFYIRDIRGGQGERKTFRVFLKWLANERIEILKPLLALVPEYGRWDDLFVLKDTPLEKEMVELVYKQLFTDEYNMKRGQPISLLAKWMPSINTSSKATRALAKWFIAQYINEKLSEKTYRKNLAVYRKYLQIPENQMCAKQWTQIDYEKVPSRAAMRYSKAFAKHDEERYTQFKEDVKSGKKEIKTSTLYPYDLVRKADTNYDETVELQWTHLPDYCEGKAENSIAVVDSSASMRGLPLYSATALGMYFAERNQGPYKNSFITFSAQARFVEIKGTTLQEKYQRIRNMNICENTNLQSVFDLVLTTAIRHNVPQSEMIERIYIISDMEFDQGTSAGWNQPQTNTNLDVIRRKYKNAGYEMPVLVYWNVDSRQDNVPAFNEQGIMLVSGSSPSIFKSMMSLEIKTPEELMLQVLNSERYAPIKV